MLRLPLGREASFPIQEFITVIVLQYLYLDDWYIRDVASCVLPLLSSLGSNDISCLPRVSFGRHCDEFYCS